MDNEMTPASLQISEAELDRFFQVLAMPPSDENGEALFKPMNESVLEIL